MATTTTTTLTVRLGETLSDYITSKIGKNGSYDNVSEYIRDLIRKDIENEDQKTFEKLKAELQLAFAGSDDQYVALSAQDIIERNKR